MFGRKDNKTKFSDLSSREQKKIMKRTIRDANKEQLDLVRSFDKKFGNLKQMRT